MQLTHTYVRLLAASLKDPKKVLFFKYEDLKEDTLLNVKKISEFLGCSFTNEEEEIVRICSFECVKNLEVNKDPVVNL